ncbi:KPN_01571 family protein [Cronobacter sakazakii]|nr:KPN_01571 family protein [Cronobacter sakazakii]MCD2437113.1 KPN_01571 family protein [Cronobacter sakazakii]MDT3575529.1 KPN_01571 family protein [Cronobacter sakazakii]
MNPFIYVFGLLLTLDALRELAGASSIIGLW